MRGKWENEGVDKSVKNFFYKGKMEQLLGEGQEGRPYRLLVGRWGAGGRGDMVMQQRGAPEYSGAGSWHSQMWKGALVTPSQGGHVGAA